MTLEAAGVSDAEESAYRILVTMGRASAHDFAVRAGLDSRDAEQTLTALTAKGLASHTDAVPRLYRATPPDVALMPRLKQQADALDHARATATGLLEIYRDTMRRSDADQLIEVITGADALRQHLRRIQADTRDEMLWFCKAQYVAMPSGSNSEEFDALARGVRYRVLYEKAFFDDEGAVDNVIEGVRAGEVARAVAHLPLRLAVSDRAIAICPSCREARTAAPRNPPRPWYATAACWRRSSRSSSATGTTRSPCTSTIQERSAAPTEWSAPTPSRQRTVGCSPARRRGRGQGDRLPDGSEPTHGPTPHTAADDVRRRRNTHATGMAGGSPGLGVAGRARTDARSGTVLNQLRVGRVTRGVLSLYPRAAVHAGARLRGRLRCTRHLHRYHRRLRQGASPCHRGRWGGGRSRSCR